MCLGGGHCRDTPATSWNVHLYTINNTSAENTELHENLVTGPVRGLHVHSAAYALSPPCTLHPAPATVGAVFARRVPPCPLTLPQHRGQPSGFFHLKIFNNPLACKLISDPHPRPQSAGKLGPIIAIVCGPAGDCT